MNKKAQTQPRALLGLALVAISLFTLPVLLLGQAPVPADKPEAYPAWWFEQEVLSRTDTNQTNPVWPGDYPEQKDYAAVNQGHVKWMARGGLAHLQQRFGQADVPATVLVSPEWLALTNMVAAWETPGVGATDYAAANQGQVKEVARHFYDVFALQEVGYHSSSVAGWSPEEAYPWPTAGSGSSDYAGVNVGQLKNLFAFDLSTWEPPGLFEPNDADGDGLDLAEELALGTDPFDPDTDNDGLNDGIEIGISTNPLADDTDGDGLLDGEEIAYGLNPLQNNSSALPFAESFDSYALGSDLAGQNGWGATAGGQATVVSEQVASGVGALRLTAAEEPAKVLYLIDPAGHRKIWVDYRVLPNASPSGGEVPGFGEDSVAQIYFTDDGILRIYHGLNQAWAVIDPAAFSVPNADLGNFQRLTFCLDYSGQTFDVYWNEVLVADGYGFAFPQVAFSRLELSNFSGHAYYDEVSVDTANPLEPPSTALPVITVASPLQVEQGQPYTETFSVSGDPSVIECIGLPEGLELDLSGTPTITGTVTSTGTYPLVFRATNLAGTVEALANLTILPGRPVFTSPSSAFAAQNVAFSYEVGVLYQVEMMEMINHPPELSFDAATKTVEGTFAQTGTQNFTIRASQDNQWDAADPELNVTVTIGVGKPVITSASEIDTVQHSAFTYQIVGTNGPTEYVATNLPPWLSLDSATGVLSGTPTEPGSRLIGLTATNEYGTGEVFLNVSVLELGTPLLNLPGVIYLAVGQPFSYQVETTPVANDYGASSLPPGLSIDTGTGLISGTPTAVATSSATVTAVNDAGQNEASTVFAVMASTPAVTSTMVFQSGVSPLPDYVAEETGIINDASQAPPEELLADEVWGAGLIGAPSAAQQSLRSFLGFSLADLPGDALLLTSSLSITGIADGTTLPTIELFSIDDGFDFETVTWNEADSFAATLLASVTAQSIDTEETLELTPASQTYLASALASADIEVRLMLKLDDENVADADRPETFFYYSNDTLPVTRRPRLEIGYQTGSPPVLFLPHEWTIQSGEAATLDVPSLHAAANFASANLPGGFTVNNTSGQISGTAPTVGTYPITLTASNANGQASLPFTIRVIPPPPVVTSDTELTVGAKEEFQYVITADNSPTSYSADNLPNGLSLDPSTGVIAGSVSSFGTYSIRLTALNEAGQSAEVTLTLTVNPEAPDITSDATVNANVGSLFEFYITASQSPDTYQAELTGSPGQLPSWLSLTGNKLHGTPDQVGDVDLTLAVANITGSDTANLVISVGAGLKPEINPMYPITGYEGDTLYDAWTISNNPTSVQMTGLPPGLSYDSANMEVVGTPDANSYGSYFVTIEATNAYGTTTEERELIIHPPYSVWPWIEGSYFYQAVEGKYAYLTLQAAYGAESAVIEGLPAGMSYDAEYLYDYGEISIYGTPTQVGNYNLNVRLTAGGVENQVPVTLSVVARPVLLSEDKILTRKGEAINYTLQASAGVTEMALTGLVGDWSFDPATGVLSGTAGEPDIVELTANLTDENGTFQYPIQVLIEASAGDLVAEFQAALLPDASYEAIMAGIREDENNPLAADESLQGDGSYQVGRLSATERRRLLLSYDLSALPDDIEITSAKLTLELPANPVSGESVEINLHEIADALLTTFPDWANNAGFQEAELSFLTLEGSASSGPVHFHSTPAFLQATGEAVLSGQPLELALMATAAEAQGQVNYLQFDLAAATPANNPKLTVTYVLVDPTEAPEIQEPLEVDLVVGQTFSYQIQASHRPDTFAASNLPAGLALNASTGLISETNPGSLAVGEYRVALEATNLVGTGTAELVIRVHQNVPVDQLEIVSGNYQLGLVEQELAEPLVVRVSHTGSPVAGALVLFEVANGDGWLKAPDGGGTVNRLKAALVTDAQGQASVPFILPAAPKTVPITATVSGADPVIFWATATSDGNGDGQDSVILRLLSGGGQSGPAGQPLPDPVVIQALNGAGQPLPGLTLQTATVAGTGSISPANGTTDGQGAVAMTLTPAGVEGAVSQFSVTESVSGTAITLQVAVNSDAGSTPTPGGARTAEEDDSTEQIKVTAFHLNSYNWEERIYEWDQPTLRWYLLEGSPDNFLIERRYEGAEWEEVTQVSGSETEFQEEGLLAGRRYNYRLSAIKNGEKSVVASAEYKFSSWNIIRRRSGYARGSKPGFTHFTWERGEPKRRFLSEKFDLRFSRSGITGRRVSVRTETPVISQGSYSYQVETDSIANEIIYSNGSRPWNFESVYVDPTKKTLETATVRRYYPLYPENPGFASTLTYTLSNEYTTSAFISDVNQSMSSYGEWFVVDEVRHNVGEGFGGLSGSTGYHMCYRDLYDSGEWGYKASVSEYQFVFYPSVSGTIHWYEIAIEEASTSYRDDPSTTTVLATRKFELGLETESETYTMDGRLFSNDVDCYVVPADTINFYETGAKEEADSLERIEGIEVTTDPANTARITVDRYGLHATNYKVQWSSSEFELRGYFGPGEDDYDVITNGHEFTYEELDNLPYSSLVLVATEGAPIGSETEFTFSIIHKGKVLQEEKTKFIYEDHRDYSFPISESSGSRYRKIALNGMPIGDGKPQSEAETDEEPEETYVDALSLGLRHSTTDVYLSVPGSDLALSARRDFSPEIWSERGGLRPQEEPDKPFGICWSTNLTPNVKIVSSVDNPKPSEPIKAYATDEGGATHTFIGVFEGSYGGAVTDLTFFPMPTAQSQQSPVLTSLEWDTGTYPPTLVLQRKFGTTVRYEMSEIDITLPADRLAGSSVGQRTQYARAKTVTDRVGNTIDFTYSADRNLVPKEISVRGRPDLKLQIRQNADGMVTSIWDANGNETRFHYSNYDYSSKANVGDLVRLDRVERADGSEVRYQYEVVSENGLEPQPPDANPVVHWHAEIRSIEDALGNTYQFAYELDHSKYNFKNDRDGDYPGSKGYFIQTGLPRNISEVTLPDGATKVAFHNDSQLWISYDDQNKAIVNGQRLNRIVDASGFERTVVFDDSEVVDVPQVRKLYPDTTSFVEPKMVVFKRMTFDHGGLGTESFEFNIDAAMALAKITDFSGNTTEFKQEERWQGDRADRFKSFLAPNAGAYNYYSDPTRQIDALGQAKLFEYRTQDRLMVAVTDEKGRRTVFEFNQVGLRTSKKMYAAAAEGGGLLRHESFEYGDPRFPGFMSRTTVHDLNRPGEPSWVTDLVTEYVADANGRVAEEIVDPDGLRLVTKSTYDANGNRLASTDPRGNTTWFAYDNRNRLTAVTHADGSQNSIRYDARGNKASETDERGVATLYEYDEFNRVVKTARDMDGSGTIETSGEDIVTGYGYNILNSRTSATDPRGATTEYFYDELQRLDYELSPAVQVKGGGTPTRLKTVYIYGANSGGTAFSSSGFKPTMTVDPRGYVASVEYDALYRPVRSTLQYAEQPEVYAVTRTQYDELGNVRFGWDPLNRVTETQYDELNRAIKVLHPDSTFTQTAYTSTGFAFQATDEEGRVTTTKYDPAGRAVELVQPPVWDGPSGAEKVPVTFTRYDAAGNVIQTENPRGEKWDYVYDARNRKVREILPPVPVHDVAGDQRPVIETGYDAVGNVVAVTDARGFTTDTDYDWANRATDVYAPPVEQATTDPAAPGPPVRPHVHTDYDKNGNVVAVTDARGIVTRNTYDALNRLKTTTQDDGGLAIVVANQYDATGNRTAVIDGNNQVTHFEYDGLGRNIRQIYGVGSDQQDVTEYRFNAVQKTDRIDPNGARTTYGYDQRDRLLNVAYSAAPGGTLDPAVNSSRAYTYDDVGNLETVTEPGKGGTADVVYRYDNLNRVIEETSGGETHLYEYDLAGNRTEVTYGNTGRQVVSTYDALNRLESMTEGARLTEYGYDLNGNIRLKTLPNGDTCLRGFDALNRKTTMSGRTHTAAPLYLYTHQYDLSGNLRHLIEDYPETGAGPGIADRTVSTTYDGASRLLAEAVDQGSDGTVDTRTEYGYDAAHNRIAKTAITDLAGTPSTVVTGYHYGNALNQLAYVWTEAGTPDGQWNSGSEAKRAEFTYDANGNRLTRTAEGATDVYIWDYENRLVALDQNTTDAGQRAGDYVYRYDYRTRRVLRDESQAGGAATTVVFAGGTSYREVEAGATTVEHIRGSDYGGGVGGILYTLRPDGQGGTASSYTHSNHRGDIVAKTNGSGLLTWQAQYEAFGTRPEEAEDPAAPNLDRQKANSKDEDPTGLLNEGFRYRDLQTGTFISRDPLGFVDGPNVYTYVKQNPWTMFDPLGLEEDSLKGKSNSVYFVSRQFYSDDSKKHESYANKFEGSGISSLVTGRLAHGYLMTTDENGDPRSTYSWHPNEWPADSGFESTYDANWARPGRVWQNDPADMNPQGKYEMILVSDSARDVKMLEDTVSDWIVDNKVGHEIGEHVPDLSDPSGSNTVSNSPDRRPAQRGATCYNVAGQNCFAWGTTMLEKSGIDAPAEAQTAIESFNNGVGTQNHFPSNTNLILRGFRAYVDDEYGISDIFQQSPAFPRDQN
ncbi:MAG: putative Ig domain-containing protein [Verrucomicrobiota bacterium]